MKKNLKNIIAAGLGASMLIQPAASLAFAAPELNNSYALLEEDTSSAMPEVSSVEKHSSSYYSGPVITFAESGDFFNNITKITVNGAESTQGYSDAAGNYSIGYSDPTIFIGYGLFNEGTNVIIISAEGYKSKVLTVTKDSDVYELVSQSDEDIAESTDEAVQNVINLINAIGNVTLEKESQIKEANDAYKALTEEQAAQVTNYSVLTSAIEQLEKLKNQSSDEKLTAPLITKVEVSTSWSGEVEGLLISEISSYGTDAEKAYCTAIASGTPKAELSVNGNILEYAWSDDGNPVWDTGYNGISIGAGAFSEGENTIIIKVSGYYDKKLVVNYDGSSYTFVSQEDIGADLTPTPTPAPDDDKTSLSDPIADGVYTLHYSVSQVENSQTSMLSETMDSNIKLTVENGVKTISILNNVLSSFLLDVSVGLDSESFKKSTRTPYGTQDAHGAYNAYIYTMEVEQLDQPHIIAALVTAMGGQESDIYDYSKYTAANLTFTEIISGWDDWQSAIDDKNNPQGEARTIAALVEAGYDTDNDNNISDEEFAAISGEVDLSFKDLTDISVLSKLSDKVTTLNISGNEIEALPSGLLDNMIGLKNFYAEYNLITDIPENFFKNNTELEWISFSGNLIQEISDNDFAGLTNLSTLDLIGNKISSVSENALASASKLSDFGIGDNLLTSLPDGFFANQKELTYIGIDNNKFTVLPKCVESASAVERLYANENLITDISNVDFSKLPNLKALNLMRNRITELKPHMFDGNNQLNEVDLHDNQLTDISTDMIPDLAADVTRLRFDITLNNIDVIPTAVKQKINARVTPQKTDFAVKASGNDKTVSYTQDLDLLNLRAWYDENVDVQNSELATLDDYKAYLETQDANINNITPYMLNYYNWSIQTEIQKKNDDGSFETVKTVSEDNKNDTLSGSFDVDEYGTYRIVKSIYIKISTFVKSCEIISNDVTLTDKSESELFVLENASVPTNAQEGDIVIFPINVSQNPGFIYGSMTFSWDKNVWELIEAEDTAKLDTSISPKITSDMDSYKLTFGNMLGTSNFTNTGTFFNLKFKVKDASKIYDSAINVKSNALLDYNIIDVPVNDSFSNGTVQLVAVKPLPTKIETTISEKTDKLVTGTVKLENIPDNSALLVSGYENGRLTGTYIKENVSSGTESFTLNSGADSIKIMVWDGISSMKNITESEIK